MSKSPLHLLRRSLLRLQDHQHQQLQSKPPLLQLQRNGGKPHHHHRHTSSSALTNTDTNTDTTPTTLRHLMRKIPHPVVIVTTTSPQNPSSPRGITLSSFNCFSLSPPLISFNIATPSTAAKAMSTSGSFAVHVLKSTPRAAHLASVFSKPRSPVSPWESVKDGGMEGGLLGREEDVLYRLRCEAYRTVQIADHQFWVGRVRGVDVLCEEEEGGGGFGLMYAEGMFRDVGREVGSDEGGDVDDGSR